MIHVSKSVFSQFLSVLIWKKVYVIARKLLRRVSTRGRTSVHAMLIGNNECAVLSNCFRYLNIEILILESNAEISHSYIMTCYITIHMV